MSIAKTPDRQKNERAILAGDVGGTKTLLGIFVRDAGRPRPIVTQSFGTGDYDDIRAVLDAFLTDDEVKRFAIGSACLGVAGPVVGSTAQLTNVSWRVDANELSQQVGAPVSLLNDLQAMAYAIPVLQDEEVRVLQRGQARTDGNIALIAAGTGLGEALLHRVDGTFVPAASEGGHADWAARTERDVDVLRDLTSRFGRAEVEQVVSGLGLVNLHHVTHTGPCDAIAEGEDPAAAISRAAMERRCAGCVEALQLFVDAYGAEAGNLALRSMATGGVFLGGGIAPKILPALEDGRFIEAFLAKAPFDGLLRKMPVRVILKSDAGLLGAAVFAAQAR